MRILFVIVMCMVGMSCDGTTGNDKRGNSPDRTGPEAGKDSLRPHYNCASYKKSNIAPNSGQGLFHTELSSTNLEEAYCLYPERRKEALNFLLKKHEGIAPDNSKDDNRSSFRNFTFWAQAALELQDEAQISKVNAILESSKAKPWNYGSSLDIPGLGFACGRVGDYDFVAFELARVVVLSRQSELGLSNAAEEKIINDLLPLYGNPPKEHKTKFKLSGFACGSFEVPETENHIIMVNVSKYLTNQLRGIDNEANGFNRWMVEHMDRLHQALLPYLE